MTKEITQTEIDAHEYAKHLILVFIKHSKTPKVKRTMLYHTLIEIQNLLEGKGY